MTFTITPTCCCETDDAYRSAEGYSRVRFEGRVTELHRVVYTAVNGPIPAGMVIRHACDNPRCVNPNHLELGTHADNVADRVKRDRSAKGQRHGRNKLSPPEVLAIRNGTESSVEAGRRFDVDPKLVRKIRKREIWAWLPD